MLEELNKKYAGVVFWDVDTQYDFMRDGSDGGYKGKLPVPQAQSIEGNLEVLTRTARQKGIRLVKTGDWHNKESEELSANPNFVTTFPEHCMINTIGADFVPATQVSDPYVLDWRDEEFSEASVRRSREIVLYKDKFDAFTGTRHAQKLIDTIVPKRAFVYGVAENVCVDYAVRGLLKRAVEVYFVTDAIKGLPGIPSPVEKWKEKGARLITTREVSDLL